MLAWEQNFKNEADDVLKFVCKRCKSGYKTTRVIVKEGHPLFFDWFMSYAEKEGFNIEQSTYIGKKCIVFSLGNC